MMYTATELLCTRCWSLLGNRTARRPASRPQLTLSLSAALQRCYRGIRRVRLLRATIPMLSSSSTGPTTRRSKLHSNLSSSKEDSLNKVSRISSSNSSSQRADPLRTLP
jgi:hypothetical protein